MGVFTVNQTVEKVWKIHAGYTYTREVWNGDKYTKWMSVHTEEEYIAFLKNCVEKFYPAHTSVYPGLLGDGRPWVSSIILEIDLPREQSYEAMRKVYRYFSDKYFTRTRVYFSGNRSFHIFADFYKVEGRSQKDLLYRLQEFASQVGKDLGIEFDMQMYSSPRKLSRVPFTLNEKTVNYAVPVSPVMSLKEILEESRSPRRFVVCSLAFSPALQEKIGSIVMPVERRTRSRKKFSTDRTFWIEELMKHPVPDGRHRLLWHVFAPYLMNVRKLSSDDAERELVKYFEMCSKTHPLQPSPSSFRRLIRYYVKLAERDGYRPWRLETIQKKDPQLFSIISAYISSRKTLNE